MTNQNVQLPPYFQFLDDGMNINLFISPNGKTIKFNTDVLGSQIQEITYNNCELIYVSPNNNGGLTVKVRVKEQENTFKKLSSDFYKYKDYHIRTLEYCVLIYDLSNNYLNRTDSLACAKYMIDNEGV